MTTSCIFPRVTSRPPRPYLAVVQYDGGGFAGWQRQPVDRTVQAEFEAVLERLMGHRTPVTGAGRTDTGVHALGQGVSFLGAERWAADPSELRRALNALLPREIWVQRVHLMRPGFDGRRSATARRYRYLIGTDEAAVRYTEQFLGYLRRPDTLTYSCLFTVLGSKPVTSKS